MKTQEVVKENTKFNEADFGLFEKLGLSEPILRSLKMQKYERPTLIQEKAIPVALAGKDIMAGSATGSGKTLAFSAGIIQHAKKGSGIQALILTPTRELAEQVANSIRLFAKYQPLRVTAIYGGVNIRPQFMELKTADVVVGTPGRILDHLRRKSIKLEMVKTLVLDEADTMFDMGFITDVESIIKCCPKNRQTLLFSATLTDEINSLAKRHTKEPVRLMATTVVDPKKLTQVYYKVSDHSKIPLLVHLLKNEKAGLSMVFCNSRRNTDFVASNLKYSGIEASAMHGGFSQDKRNKVIKQFHTKKLQVLVCTDVAAKGLDINGVSHVYNYDIPRDSKQYIHRIGRTARAGKEGIAVNMLSIKDHKNFSKVVRDNSIDVAKKEMPNMESTKNLSIAR